MTRQRSRAFSIQALTQLRVPHPFRALCGKGGRPQKPISTVNIQLENALISIAPPPATPVRWGVGCRGESCWSPSPTPSSPPRFCLYSGCDRNAENCCCSLPRESYVPSGRHCSSTTNRPCTHKPCRVRSAWLHSLTPCIAPARFLP